MKETLSPSTLLKKKKSKGQKKDHGLALNLSQVTSGPGALSFTTVDDPEHRQLAPAELFCLLGLSRENREILVLSHVNDTTSLV